MSGVLIAARGAAKTLLEPCPHCGSQWRAVDFDAHTVRWSCGTTRRGMLVERSFGCYEIEALKREAKEG